MMVLVEASFSFKPSREISAMAKTQEYMQNLLAIQWVFILKEGSSKLLSRKDLWQSPEGLRIHN